MNVNKLHFLFFLSPLSPPNSPIFCCMSTKWSSPLLQCFMWIAQKIPLSTLNFFPDTLSFSSYFWSVMQNISLPFWRFLMDVSLTAQVPPGTVAPWSLFLMTADNSTLLTASQVLNPNAFFHSKFFLDSPRFCFLHTILKNMPSVYSNTPQKNAVRKKKKKKPHSSNSEFPTSFKSQWKLWMISTNNWILGILQTLTQTGYEP